MKCPCGEIIDTDRSRRLGVCEIDCRCGRVYTWNSKKKGYKYRITRKLAIIYDLPNEVSK